MKEIDERLKALERTVAQLVQGAPQPGKFKDWRQAAGMFKGRELQKAIDAAGQRIRQADRRRNRS